LASAAAVAVPWGTSRSAAHAASLAQSRRLSSPEWVCAHAGAARHAGPARAAGRLAARITDTSGMWLAAGSVAHVLGSTTSSGEPWVFTAMVMPHLGANDGPALCVGLWVGRRADGHGVTCGQPPLGTPDAVDFRASAVPMAQGVRFAVATVPPGVRR